MKELSSSGADTAEDAISSYKGMSLEATNAVHGGNEEPKHFSFGECQFGLAAASSGRQMTNTCLSIHYRRPNGDIEQERASFIAYRDIPGPDPSPTYD